MKLWFYLNSQQFYEEHILCCSFCLFNNVYLIIHICLTVKSRTNIQLFCCWTCLALKRKKSWNIKRKIQDLNVSSCCWIGSFEKETCTIHKLVSLVVYAYKRIKSRIILGFFSFNFLFHKRIYIYNQSAEGYNLISSSYSHAFATRVWRRKERFIQNKRQLPLPHWSCMVRP